jgi:hypothetical protein
MNVSQLIAYESGELAEEEVYELFQDLVATGTINHLQGSYQRHADALISEGLIQSKADYESEANNELAYYRHHEPYGWDD